MPKIAITGTIASGKSIVSSYIKSKGYFVLDLDEVNRELLDNDEIVLNEIKEKFNEAFTPVLDKKILARIVFNDTQKKKELEDILYPRIKEIMFRSMNEHDTFFCEVPLLFESGFDIYFDESWLIVADDETSINRLINKGYTRLEATMRIASQMSIEEKKKRATKIIYNKDTFDFLYREVDEALNSLC